jgi:hypothetical protein
MANWTRKELETAYPPGTVTRQINHDIIVLSDDEWSAWIEQQVGTEKGEEEPA